MKAVFIFVSLLCLIQGKGMPNPFSKKRVEKNSFTIKARVGREFAIKVSSNPSTGYSWSLAKLRKSGILVLLSKTKMGEFTSVNPSKGFVGALGMQRYVFYPKRPGKQVLKLVYRRPWEKTPVAINTYYVKVK